MIVNNCYHENLQPFLTRIEKVAEDRNIPNKREYIADRRWRMRASGKYSDSKTTVIYQADSTKWEARVTDAQKNLFDWLPALGEYSYKKTEDKVLGELSFQKEVFQFEIDYLQSTNNFKFILFDNNNVQLRYLLRRLINKTAHCINCEACELECPVDALSVYPTISIDTTKCIHCHKCLEYHNVGCIVADSMIKPTEINPSNMKISKYGTFGFHQDWLDQYLKDPNSFWSENTLGSKQVPSFKAWLKDAEIIDNNANITEFGKICAKINENSSTLLWELIFINLSYNSPLIKWFISAIDFNAETSRKSLDHLALDYFQPSFKETTIIYAVQALLQTFKYSPIGEEFNQLIPQDKKGTIFTRMPYEELSSEAIAYSLYKYADFNDIKMLRVSDLYRTEEKKSVYKEFGISKNSLLKSLRHLSSNSNRVLIAELNMGLDHITLREDLSAVDALKILF